MTASTRAARSPEATGPLWRDRRFGLYWSGQGVSQLGDRISELAIPLIAVTMLHASSIEVGLLTAAVWAPNLLSLITGAWVDQRPRKQPLMIAADLVRAAAIASLPITYWLGGISLGQLFAVALIAGAGGTLYQTAYPNFFVALVRRDQFVEANSLLSTTRSASFIAGPALGGLLISVLTAPIAMVLDAISFLVSAILLRGVRVEERPPDHDPNAAGLLRRAGEGMAFLWRSPVLAASLRCCTMLNFFSFVVNALLILFASRHLALPAATIGLALGIGAGGGLLGAVLAPRIARLIGAGRSVVIGGVLFALPFAALSLASGSDLTKAAVLASVEAVSGAGVMLFDVNLNAIQTAVTPDGMRSRISGAFSSVNYGVRPLGAIVGGVAGTVFGIGPTIIVAAIGGALSVVWLLPSPIPGIRRVDDLVAKSSPPRY